MPITILHLSDLHYGEASKDEVEWKQRPTLAENTQYIERLPGIFTALYELNKKPDFIVISGDITIAGKDYGFNEFQKNFMTYSDSLPQLNKILIVPGNHDLNQKKVETKERFKNFISCIDNLHLCRPLFEGLDINTRKDYIKSIKNSLTQQDFLGRDVEIKDTSRPKIPFILDKKNKILIYGFNSAIISGSKLKISDEINKILNSFNTISEQLPLSLLPAIPGINFTTSDVKKIIAQLEQELQIDPARICSLELDIFDDITEILKNSIGADFDNYLKIAVLHHHLVPFIAEEFKKFEIISNAGRFKKYLIDKNFQLILHGHKHYPVILEDTAIFKHRDKKLNMISGATIGGGIDEETWRGFNLIEWNHNTGDINIEQRAFTNILNSQILKQEALKERRRINIYHNNGGPPKPTCQPAVNIKITDSITFNLIPIKGGQFMMGSSFGASDEKVVHPVKISDFYMSETVVTNKEYCEFLNSIKDKKEGKLPWIDIKNDNYCGIEYKNGKFKVKVDYEELPVVYVSWHGAIKYCDWLNEINKTNKLNSCNESLNITKTWFKLPTEAEWEYACRAGTLTNYYWGEEDKSRYCWYLENSSCRLKEVKSKDPNRNGLYNMIGNVYEWCNDWWSAKYYIENKGKLIINPTGPDVGKSKVFRGGSFAEKEIDISTVWFRGYNVPNTKEYDIGFRIVATIVKQ